MKRFLLILAALICFAISASAQVVISGTQKRHIGQNAELVSQKVKINRTMTIVSVTGHHNGFWITKNGKSEKAFWTEKTAADAVGYKLIKGEYQVYPNIRQGENEANVTLKLH